MSHLLLALFDLSTRTPTFGLMPRSELLLGLWVIALDTEIHTYFMVLFPVLYDESNIL